jgi:ribosome biogenesis protein Tsr3
MAKTTTIQMYYCNERKGKEAEDNIDKLQGVEKKLKHDSSDKNSSQQLVQSSSSKDVISNITSNVMNEEGTTMCDCTWSPKGKR